jgi:hypothetical protein
MSFVTADEHMVRELFPHLLGLPVLDHFDQKEAEPWQLLPDNLDALYEWADVIFD